MKISEYLYFSTGLCCIVFGENCNSLNIQNGGPKCFSCALHKTVTSSYFDDVIVGKMNDPTRKAKSGVNANRFLSTFQNMFILLIRNSLNFQSGGPKFAKFTYFCKILQICSDLKTKYIFVINMII